jgi:N-methylhydantoinase A
LSGYRVSIDIGGTFTDLVVVNEETGALANIKVPSTPTKPSDAVMSAIREFLKSAKASKVTSITHATTIAVNTLLGQLGLEIPKTALITTKGFRDVLEIGRQRRPELYNLSFQKPRPLIPRMYRYEVNERTGAKGEEIKPLDEKEIVELSHILKKENFKSVAIGFINSYAQPAHEEEAERFLGKTLPDLRISSSNRIAREQREYERMSTTVVNACLMPIITDYTEELTNRLKSEAKISCALMIMQSNGGVATSEVIAEKPVTVIESGPAAGVIATSFYSKLLGIRNMLSFDMGGTTAKAGTVIDGLPEVTSEYEVGGRIHSGRIVKGSGYPVRFPFVDLVECGAGGGTIAWVDEGGGMQLGPMSAGADPGPACYGRGGDKPTVTDANIVLGRLNPKQLLAGRLKIHRDLAEKSIKKMICDKTGLTLIEAAAGIISIAVSEINKITRMVSVERGIDPRSFTLLAFGGAGPMHACPLAEELSISHLVVPLNPGLFSALGLISADFVHHDSRPVLERASEVSADSIEKLFNEMEEETGKLLLRERVLKENAVFERQLDVRYLGQAYELRVPAMNPFGDEALKEAQRRFHLAHQSTYGFSSEEEEVEIVNARVTARGITTKPPLPRKPKVHRNQPEEAITSKRTIYIDEENATECPIYGRDRLMPGDVIEAPSIVEQYDSTTVVFPDWTCEVDEYGNLRLQEQT